mgnify:CR=1 FL=1
MPISAATYSIRLSIQTRTDLPSIPLTAPDLDRFQHIVSQYPDRTAIVDMDGARCTTYRELGELSRRVAAKLCAQAKSGAVSGIDGRSVLVCMDRRMEYPSVMPSFI